ncbi:MAG: hypothetical protein HUK19_00985 [Fibrobacter sp.]|nr:hypothetical protein [Fibrobacter sp.]
MKKLFIVLMALTAINAFASSATTAPGTPRNKTLKLDVAHIDSLVIEQSNDGSKALQVKGNTDNSADQTFDMKDVSTIQLLKGKNPDDKVTFYINGEKKTYKVSDIKSITIKTIERAN